MRRVITLWLLVALAVAGAAVLLGERGGTTEEEPAPVRPAAVTTTSLLVVEANHAEPVVIADDAPPPVTETVPPPATTAPPEPEPAPGPEPVTPVPVTDGCEAAVAQVVGRVGLPGTWTIVCDPRDGGYRGQADLQARRITIFWNESRLEYERTVAHELGHAWDSHEWRTDWHAAQAVREGWLGRAMATVEVTDWYWTYAEAYAEHLAATWGYPGAGH